MDAIWNVLEAITSHTFAPLGIAMTTSKDHNFQYFQGHAEGNEKTLALRLFFLPFFDNNSYNIKISK